MARRRFGAAPHCTALPGAALHCGALRLGRDLVLDGLRHHVELRELHGVLRPALGHATQVGHVVEHLRQGDEGVNHLRGGGERGGRGEKGSW